MFGRFGCIVIGMYAGILIKQRYRIPELISPGEILGRMKAFEHNQRWEDYQYRYHNHGCCHHPDQGDRGPRMWERMREFEQRHRREQPTTPPPQPTQQTAPTATSGESEAASC
ncbi:uncharacterized protein LOC101864216 [Aplysia californica]|uniref:Uncharacterized protein LOC101864216 n=1 Tax=Aplysia californica TaxID=6500 RepID=A0ABM0JKW8_APLCA|nr:uncharacterized protein LOC101864216 [Aplysia californica]